LLRRRDLVLELLNFARSRMSKDVGDIPRSLLRQSARYPSSNALSP